MKPTTYHKLKAWWNGSFEWSDAVFKYRLEYMLPWGYVMESLGWEELFLSDLDCRFSFYRQLLIKPQYYSVPPSQWSKK